MQHEDGSVPTLRRVVLVVALLNLGYFAVELSVALSAGSVALLADSVDFLEDTAVNLLIFVALGWPMARRALMGKLMALLILGPAALAALQAVRRFAEPVPPDVLPVVLASLGAVVVNAVSAWLLVRVRHEGGSLSRAAYLSARNDAVANLAIIAAGLVTALHPSPWPDLVVAAGIAILNADSAADILKAAAAERRAAG